MASIATNAASPIHPRLMRFFARFPPQKYSSYITGQKIPTQKQRVSMNAQPLTSTSIPSLPGAPEDSTASIDPEQLEPQADTTTTTKVLSNPFLPTRTKTGKWYGPIYGLRKQADLFKLAREYGIEELLPASIKSSEFKQRRALERGLQVKGTGEGQKVKGHKWERQLGAVKEKRRIAMEEMPEMIRLWKEKGHGRGWKKYPK